MARVQVAILDDYQSVAMEMADWSAVAERADITIIWPMATISSLGLLRSTWSS